MAIIQPKGEDIRKAVKWISEMRQSETSKPLAKLVEEAGLQFDLSPMQIDFLYKYIAENQSD